MMCDVYGAWMADVHARLTSADMISITEAGYVPPKLPANWDQETVATGVSKADAWRMLVDVVIGDRGMWGLCPDCYCSVRRFKNNQVETDGSGLGYALGLLGVALLGFVLLWLTESVFAMVGTGLNLKVICSKYLLRQVGAF